MASINYPLAKKTEVDSALATITQNIGDLSELDTANQNNVVEAINEVAARQVTSIKEYGVLWDRVNAQMTRTRDAVGITADTTNFKHSGTKNMSYDNPFDGIYPWSHIKACNIDEDLYKTIKEENGNIDDAVIAWEGDPEFKEDGSNKGTWIYIPVNWQRENISALGNEYCVADGPLPGYKRVERFYAPKWFATALLTGMTSRPGVAITNETATAMLARAKQYGMTLDDIYTYSAITMLYLVEFANMNTQTTLGKGVSNLYKADVRPYINEASANKVVMTNSEASSFFEGVQIHIGTGSDGRQKGARVVTQVVDYGPDSDYDEVWFDGDPIDIETTDFVSALGLANVVVPELTSKSGYIGTNGKSEVYYRGMAFAGNRFRLVLGAYREKNTNKIWIADSPEKCATYAGLDKTYHTATDFIMPTGAEGAAVDGYVDDFFNMAKLPGILFGKSVNGDENNPVGDRLSIPTLDTDNTVLYAGGYARITTNAGRFYANWTYTAATSHWSSASLPFLK